MGVRKKKSRGSSFGGKRECEGKKGKEKKNT